LVPERSSRAGLCPLRREQDVTPFPRLRHSSSAGAPDFLVPSDHFFHNQKISVATLADRVIPD
jgi:hypothetical protein